jgi:hypothetical protein
MDVLIYMSLMSAMAFITTTRNGMSISIFMVSEEHPGRALLGTKLALDTA